jgi:hypothetical protein
MRSTERALLPLLVVIAACGAPAPTFEGNVFRAQGVAFRVGDIPPEWHRVDVDGTVLAFRDDHGSSVLVNARCQLRSDDVPLVALTNQLVIGTTEREYVSEETMPFDRREARHTVMRAKLDGVMLMWDAYVMKKDSCVYDMVFVAPPDRFEHGSAAFERFATQLHTIDDKTP